jgi:hypothetical protein
MPMVNYTYSVLACVTKLHVLVVTDIQSYSGVELRVRQQAYPFVGGGLRDNAPKYFSYIRIVFWLLI